MKKWLLIWFPFLVCFLMCYSIANAQFTIGIHGGLGITNLKGGNSHNPGFSLPYGVYTDWPFNTHFSLHIEANHLLLGSVSNKIHPVYLVSEEISDAVYYTNSITETRLHYIDMPVMLKYKYLMLPDFNAYIQAGPSIKLLVAATDVNNGNAAIYADPEGVTVLNTSHHFNSVKNTKAIYKSWNYGVAAATGVAWQLQRETMFLEMGIDRGLFPVQKKEGEEADETILWYIAVGLGYKLH